MLCVPELNVTLFMSDKELILSIFKNIAWSLEQIMKRFQSIQSSEDFIIE